MSTSSLITSRNREERASVMVIPDKIKKQDVPEFTSRRKRQTKTEYTL